MVEEEREDYSFLLEDGEVEKREAFVVGVVSSVNDIRISAEIQQHLQHF
jgi:hypothetical protein